MAPSRRAPLLARDAREVAAGDGAARIRGGAGFGHRHADPGGDRGRAIESGRCGWRSSSCAEYGRTPGPPRARPRTERRTGVGSTRVWAKTRGPSSRNASWITPRRCPPPAGCGTVRRFRSRPDPRGVQDGTRTPRSTSPCRDVRHANEGQIGFAGFPRHPALHQQVLWSALLVFGLVKARFTGTPPLRGGLQTLATGGLAAAAAFGIARLIS